MPNTDKALMHIRCPSCLMHDADPYLRHDAAADQYYCLSCGYRGSDEEARALQAVKWKFYPLLKRRNTFGLSK